MTVKHAFLGLIVLVIAGGGWIAHYLTTPVPLPATPFEFSVKPGTTLRGVAQQLAQAGAVAHPFLFTWVARLSGKGTALKAGNYALETALTPWDLLQKLTKGDVTQNEVKFIEGWTFRQMRQALDRAPGLQHETQGLSPAEIMARLGFPEQHPEGRFFPDTYFFSSGMSDLALLARAHKLMHAQLESAWRDRAPNLPYVTPDEALIMASIVEKETGQASERPMIAGVFVNRLRIGMLLQTDPTVIYGLGETFDGNLRRRDLLADTPYNTYTRGGLPPTPIAMPGLGALQAALQPAETKALYFVARGNGSHQFSSTLAQHNQAVNRYQRNQK
ncbi:MAG: endolytic transglycosylase MltG [Hydrogenophilales bacterium]|nr:endolytic transglycosylase MltG [Hydrogenophilales bacterium]